jgi:hypothetical protein
VNVAYCAEQRCRGDHSDAVNLLQSLRHGVFGGHARELRINLGHALFEHADLLDESGHRVPDHIRHSASASSRIADTRSNTLRAAPTGTRSPCSRSRPRTTLIRPSVFRMGEDGKLSFARTYDIDVGDKIMWWMGMVPL